MSRKIRADGLAAAVAEELKKYSQKIADGVKDDVKTVAKECRDEIKTNSAEQFGGTGEYAKGWSNKVEFESRSDIRIAVHNKKNYQLTHLLEKGHAKVNGGRVEGRPHIAPAEERAAEKLEKRVKVTVKK